MNKSLNFEFLRPGRPELADLAAFAEQYARPDPASAIVKLRTFAEQATLSLYQTMGLPIPEDDSFFTLLTDTAFSSAVPKPVLDTLHLVRTTGNRGAHGKKVATSDVFVLLHEAHRFAQWIYLTHAGGDASTLAPFQVPPAEKYAALEDKAQEREREKLLQQIAAKEAETQQLLEELHAARQQAEAIEKSKEQLEALLAHGSSTLNALHFDEAATRKHLVDRMLLNAGWNVGRDGVSTDEVGQEVEVLAQPTTTGLGLADYVLWDDSGKPLAVIEAKRTAFGVEKGRTQAKCYADGLEKKYGQRPIVFYSNGWEIWIENDEDGEVPRRIFGFYAKDSLRAIHSRRLIAQSPDAVPYDPAIISWLFQIEALKRIVEDFSAKKRKALVVMATGTGKTRVAVALCDVLSRANVAQRVLFLCDRLELRKQAHQAFKEYLPGQPRTFVTARTAEDRNQRIYLATYPAMMKCYETFDPGFFDLVIADESHRSVYNRYRNLFVYFDALQVGLTATPVDMVSRNTYKLFDRPAKDPTANYPLEKAVEDGFLVPFRVFTQTTQFLRDGMKYSQMTREQQEVVDEEDERPELFNVSPDKLDKAVFNKDTNRIILRNLMEHGIREATESHPGKTIVFARNHNHAILLEKLFHEMYPQYGGDFCRVIDNYDPRADKLIDDFKDIANRLTIAISVDMLDTGIDVPEIVNLVFARPVFSKVKFWQMIGRGTRIRKNLFGAGKHKKEFFIFDHWGNFERFDVRDYKDARENRSKALLELLFEARVGVAAAALDNLDQPVFETALDLIQKDIRALPETSVPIRERWRQVKTVQDPEILRAFEETTRQMLLTVVAPLMQWRDLAGDADAYRFDLLAARLQIELLRRSAAFADLRDEVINQVNQLRKNLNPVQAKAALIVRVNQPNADFWKSPTFDALEDMRVQLRGIMKFRQKATVLPIEPKVYDIPEEETLIVAEEYKPLNLESMEQTAYRNRVESVLKDLIKTNPTLQKIRRGQPVSEKDIDALVKLVLVQDSMVDLRLLHEFYPDTVGRLDYAIRRIIGLDGESVERLFTDFVNRYSAGLSARQIQFLDLLKNHIRRHGAIELEQLYEPPFTTIHAEGIDGVFKDESQVNFLFDVIERFKPQEGHQPSL